MKANIHPKWYEDAVVSCACGNTFPVGASKPQIKLDIFAALDIKLVWDYPLIQRAFRLSCQLDRPNVYDAVYLALAERERCDLWTADLRFVHVAAQSYPFIRSLG